MTELKAFQKLTIEERNEVKEFCLGKKAWNTLSSIALMFVVGFIGQISPKI